MKILLFADINSSHTKKWVEGICKYDFEVGVFSLRPPTGDWINEHKNLTIYSTEQRSTLLGKLSYLRNVNYVKRLVKAFNPEIVHAHYATSYGLLGVLSKPKRLFISAWGTDIFGFPKKSALHKKLLEYILSKAEKLFSTSQIMAEEMRKYTSQSIQVIPFGVDISLFSPLGKNTEKERITIGTVKTLAPTYGIDRLVNACVTLHQKHPLIECHIYGDGPLKEVLNNKIQEHKAENYILLKGAIPHQRVPDVLNTMDIFCNLSRNESFGVAILEASACELPIVATKVGGIPEVVTPETGFLCNEDQQEINVALEQLIINEELRETLGKNGRTWVLENYDWTKNLEEMIKYYR